MTLALRAMQDHLRGRKQPHAIVFADLKAAFYSVLRIFLAAPPTDALTLQAQLRELGLDEHTVDAVADHVAHTMHEGGWVEETLIARLQHLLEATWFVMSEGTRLVSTGAGSRPGDPLADLIFALIVGPVLQSLHLQLSEAGHAPQLSYFGELW